MLDRGDLIASFKRDRRGLEQYRRDLGTSGKWGISVLGTSVVILGKGDVAMMSFGKGLRWRDEDSRVY